ncbi:MAG: aminotransferase class V-fold PLP-dependent enzyme, partial [SAR324 cluster bacterium]|nr:aminotransferase class V-fold PLP-dependent enzyme [SAR324 cluster bacterium]
MNYDLETIRSQFPALALTDKGQPRVYLDNPAGTQVPVQVIQRMSDYLIHCNANQGGTFKTSIESDLILEEAHQAMADLLNAGSSSEIIFGANMTTLTYAISRSLGKRFQKGGALLLTRMDHDGNVAPWLQLAEDLGLEVRWLEFDLETYEYKLEMLENLLEPEDVLLAAVNYSSNCLGTINDIKTITEKVKSKGGLVYIDAVQYVP